ncbi:hypothetical protein SUGI_1061360 [Cryptomeria japonica]|uniref:uncharacterized protein LOC131071897 n=1 Tax=Cryptomeria japonica TaxID=3369 RepID=UPI002414BE8C|nr:uncharacterized protein LOC131071897 [Cryptomeria japonica]GLJ49923.1 hypothetical protein SUGI_1061360 [Cryptomeria japonica]
MGAPQEVAKGADENGTRDATPTTNISHAQFLLWKQRKDALAAAKAAEVARKRAEDIAGGRARMNGRELFEHEPWVFDDSRFD